MGEGLIALICLILGALCRDLFRSRARQRTSDATIDNETAKAIAVAKKDDSVRRVEIEAAADRVIHLDDAELVREFDSTYGPVSDVDADGGGADG